MTRQLEQWRGEFGREYTDRNVFDWRLRVPAFRRMVQGLALGSTLEIGCNRGYNLLAMQEILDPSTRLVGVEPNPHAAALARASSPRITCLEGSVFQLPFEDGAFDLVFTAGVLIHVAPHDLPRALDEICRVSRRYVLAIEYYAEQETTLPYRGQSEQLWKRDFGKHYQTRFPALRLLDEGYWDTQDGFDRTNWWLLGKPAGADIR